MPTKNSSLAIIAKLFAVVFAGCESSPPEATWKGEHVTVVSSDDIRPCAGTVEFYDRIVTHNFRYWTGEEPPESLQLRLELREADPDRTQLRGQADVEASVAWTSNRSYALHFLSKLVIGWEDGLSTPLWTEGMAEALGPQWIGLHSGPAVIEPLRVLFDPQLEVEADHYIAAAHLAHFMLRKYGVAEARRAYQAADPTMSAEAIEAAFVEVYGDELYDALEEFEEVQHCSVQVWECGSEVLSQKTLPVRIERTQGCDDPETLGAVGHDPFRWSPEHRFTIELGPGETTLEVDASDNASIWVQPCLQDCVALAFVPKILASADRENPYVERLPAGRYTVAISAMRGNEPFSAEIRVAP